MDFFVDIVATNSILNTKLTQNAQKTVSVVGGLRSSTIMTFPAATEMVIFL